MALHTNYVNNVIGKVVSIVPPYKAVLSFQYQGKTERALLRADKIIIDGKNVPLNEPIMNYVVEGTVMRFSCHGFDESGQDRCSYFVTMAWHYDDVAFSEAGSIAQVFHGIYNASGIVSQVSHRQGVITFVDTNDREQNILFLASKVFLFGKRVSAKQNLQQTLTVDDKVQFDAVPCESTENDYRCSWFATVVWKGKKPYSDYDHPATSSQNKSLSMEMKQLISNPKSKFFRGEGQILEILNEEYGVALGAVKQNNWESILFHRNSCFLFKLNLGSHDLTKIFQEGDRVRFIAASAPKQFITQWVASHVTIHLSKDLEDNF